MFQRRKPRKSCFANSRGKKFFEKNSNIFWLEETRRGCVISCLASDIKQNAVRFKPARCRGIFDKSKPHGQEKENKMEKRVVFVKVFVNLSADVVGRAVKQVLNVFCLIENVESSEEADLVIFDDVKKIEKGFDKEKTYAYLEIPGGGKKLALPGNVSVIPVTEAAVLLLTLIQDLIKKKQPIAEQNSRQEEVATIRPDAKRILVIDDTPKHIASAKKTLAGHHLTTVMSYEDAMEVLEKKKFDVVLTDLHLPMSSNTLSRDAFKLGELVPYGILLMIEAARQGAKQVAVVTDLNHHSDPFSAAFDHYSRFPVRIEGAKVLMLHARIMEDGSKSWENALARLEREDY